MDVITYPCHDLCKSMSVQKGQVVPQCMASVDCLGYMSHWYEPFETQIIPIYSEVP